MEEGKREEETEVYIAALAISLVLFESLSDMFLLPPNMGREEKGGKRGGASVLSDCCKSPIAIFHIGIVILILGSYYFCCSSFSYEIVKSEQTFGVKVVKNPFD